MFLIPHDAHQIWIQPDDRTTLPDRYIPMINSWFTRSGLNHVLHSHQDLLDLLIRDYPQFLDFYKDATYITEKSDICRYLLMHKYGGVYADADMLCMRPLITLLHSLKKPICMCMEPPRHVFWGRTIIGSAFIASAPGLDLWIELIEFMKKYYRPDSFPVLTTGPIIVDYFLHTYGYMDQIEILDSKYMFPADTTGITSEPREESYCSHAWTGFDTWLAQVPLYIRQTLYSREHKDIETLHAYMDAALDPNATDYNIEDTHLNNEREDYIRKLELSLKEAQEITYEKEAQIQKLDPALREAQAIVKANEERIGQLEKALQEAQEYVWKRDSELGDLKARFASDEAKRKNFTQP